MQTDLIRQQRPSRRRVVATRLLDDLTRRVGALWGIEPRVSPSLRQHLVDELHHLDVDLERLVLRSAGGIDVSFDDLRSCQQRYLWLRERWAATPFPEGWAA